MLGRSRPIPGAIDGDHCDRDRLLLTNAVSGFPLRSLRDRGDLPAARQPADAAQIAAERQLPRRVHHPVVFGVIVGQALVVVEARELRECVGGAVGGVGKECGRLRGVDVSRERVRRLEAQSVLPPPPDLHQQRVVPGVAVALLQLDGGEGGVRPRRAGREKRASRRRAVAAWECSRPRCATSGCPASPHTRP